MTHEADNKTGASGWRRYVNALIGREISGLSRYYDKLIQWLPRKDDQGLLLERIEAPEKEVARDDESFPDLTGERDRRTAVLVNGAFNHSYDIQGHLLKLRAKVSRSTRVVLVLYNPYLSWLYRLANALGLRKGALPTTFLTRTDLANLCRVSGFEPVRTRQVAYFPWKLLGVGSVINGFMRIVPLLRWFSLVNLVVLRPLAGEGENRPSLSVVIPARNEKGNIENALKRMPDLGCDLEVIFVEGNSTDDTWAEIQRVEKEYADRFSIVTCQQTGKGKGDAVRLAFSKAGKDLLTILDADLTMPPEMLGRFYEAYCEGHADFINGSRLVYPMEGEAMRFLNRLGNVFFAKALSWVLDTRLGDSLCGTKMVLRSDYDRMIAWRKDFGDFDPFGDFELLFPAAQLGLGVVDIPIRYRDRTYGATNISRFRHGFMLLRMTFTGLFKLKMRTCAKAENG